MRRAAILLASLWLGAAPVAAEEATPTDVVRQLYAEPHPRHSALYTPRLQALFDADAKRPKGGALDFDYRLNHEPVGRSVLKNLSFVETRTGANRTEIDVSLVDDRPQRIVYVLTREDGAWRVDDARSLGEPAWQLTTLLGGEAR